MDDDGNHQELLGLTAKIVASHASSNKLATSELPGADRQCVRGPAHGRLGENGAAGRGPGAGGADQEVGHARVHRLPGRRQEDEDAQAVSGHALRPDAGRRTGSAGGWPRTTRWWPKAYAAQRSELARSNGLGRRRADPNTLPRPPSRSPRRLPAGWRPGGSCRSPGLTGWPGRLGPAPEVTYEWRIEPTPPVIFGQRAIINCRKKSYPSGSCS